MVGCGVVGESVGCDVVGVMDGAELGEELAEGFWLGEEVGEAVGPCEGEELGTALGLSEGLAVGLSVFSGQRSAKALIRSLASMTWRGRTLCGIFISLLSMSQSAEPTDTSDFFPTPIETRTTLSSSRRASSLLKFLAWSSPRQESPRTHFLN